MAAPLDISPVEAEATPEAVLAGARPIEGLSLGRIAWRRLRRDKIAMAGGIIVVLLILVAVIGPHVVQNPDAFHQNLIDPTFSRPKGAFGGISLDHPLGVEPVNGRDVLSRIVNGAQYSLLIAFLATFLAVALGVIFGVTAGYFGGWVDAFVARSMDVFLAFPLLVFAIALAGVIPYHAFGLSGNALRIALLIFIIGFFNWPYVGRIIRGQALSLREREFVDAARSLGARSGYLIFRELLPNLVAEYPRADVSPGVFEGANRRRPPDDEGHHHVREHDDIAERNDRECLVDFHCVSERVSVGSRCHRGQRPGARWSGGARQRQSDGA